MKVLVVTACTGMKRVTHPRQLTLKDFKKGEPHVQARTQELTGCLYQARTMYTGQQHTRLLRGIAEAQGRVPGLDVDLRIVSAGYGILRGDHLIAPYEATFSDMGAPALVKWGAQLGLPGALATIADEERDLNILLLGDPYLKASAFEDIVEFETPTLAFCSTTLAKKLEPRRNVHLVPLYNPDAKRFRCGLTALKGELAGRVLCLLGKTSVKPLLGGSASDILDRLFAFKDLAALESV